MKLDGPIVISGLIQGDAMMQCSIVPFDENFTVRNTVVLIGTFTVIRK